MRVKREHPELRPRLLLDEQAGEAPLQTSVEVCSEGVTPSCTDADTRLADADTDRAAIAGRPSRLTASHAAASTSTFTGRFAAPFSFFCPRSARRRRVVLSALDAATDHVARVHGVVVLDRGFLERERTRGALAVLPCDLLQRLGIVR